MKIGFDNEKYLAEQSAEIRRRAARFGKLYLEFGGKLMNDFHAARCLPGYDPNVKLRLLQSLKDQAEIILAIYAGDIEHKKMRADFGISYADDALKLIDDLKALGLLFRGVVITRYAGQTAAQHTALESTVVHRIKTVVDNAVYMRQGLKLIAHALQFRRYLVLLILHECSLFDGG